MALDSAAAPSREMFLPCVLDRLTDRSPESRTERYPRAISVAVLKRSVLRNVLMILNSRSHLADVAYGGDPVIGQSVLALGLGDFCGLSYGRERREQLRKALVRQLALYEPRLDARQTEVTFRSDGRFGGAAGVLEFEIRSVLAVEPLKEEFVFRARLDLEAGEAVLESREKDWDVD